MAPHQWQQSPILGADTIQFSPAVEEMVVHQADYVKAVRYDQSVGEVFAHERPIYRGQIHAHHAH
jgi:hypothetical protein